MWCRQSRNCEEEVKGTEYIIDVTVAGMTRTLRGYGAWCGGRCGPGAQETEV